MATSVFDVLREAERHLDRHDIKMPRNDALLLLSAVMEQRVETLLAHPELHVSEHDSSTYWEWLRKRARNYPLQYLTGRQEFYGRSFVVSPSVLIPRPETETVVQACLDFLTSLEKPATVLDIGTGSGCIAITLLCEIPNLTACAIDTSREALQVATQNSQALKCADRLELVHGSTVDPLIGTSRNFDLAVSNPPYVAQTDSVEPEVEYEPGQAVFAGQSGLEVYSEILSKTACLLTSTGRLILEAGFGQAEMINQLGKKNGWNEMERRPDLAGIDRCLVLQHRGTAVPT
ncbi:MAG TPA: peptide chain release factor N(5)-glutamine methyltransferase [Acidobacteriota bacterium]|nr:peptide chain release factor N(5)-glutamine methyltransferase [Acidobacteriota bacterium]